MSVVLDASAVLAFVFDEPGGEPVSAAFADAVIPATGWAETLQKIRERDGDPAEASSVLEQLGVAIVDVTSTEAEIAASLWQRGRGLSLADRFCIALGQVLDLPVWTCHRDWASVDPRIVVLR